ncbi:hypothetical protein [Clavibacter tessellarius]|uniref:hypothetical protein n=1 Tax=Clavibacter tessellarius TaxID=31965 RepID=UPI0032459FD1
MLPLLPEQGGIGPHAAPGVRRAARRLARRRRPRIRAAPPARGRLRARAREPRRRASRTSRTSSCACDGSWPTSRSCARPRCRSTRRARGSWRSGSRRRSAAASPRRRRASSPSLAGVAVRAAFDEWADARTAGLDATLVASHAAVRRRLRDIAGTGAA